MILLRGTLGRTLIVLAAASAVACSSDKKTLLLVDVSLGAGVDPPDTVSLTVTKDHSPLGAAAFSWSKAKNGTLRTGVYLPDSATGSVDITAVGTAGSIPTGAGQGTVGPIQAGQTNGPYKLTLQIPSSGGDAGVPDTGADAAADLNNPEVAPIAPDGGGADLLAVDGRGAESAVPDGGNNEVLAVDGWGPESGLPSDDAGDAPVDGNLPDAPLPSLDGPGVDAPINSDTAPATPDAAPEPDASPPLTWQPATNVENDVVARSFDPAIAVEPLTENVFVAWYESGKVKVLRYDRKVGTWSATKTLEDRGLPYGVGIGTDANGHIIVAWYQDARASDPALPGVWVSHSSDGTSWSPPQQVVRGTVVTDWGGRNSLHLAVARIGIARMSYSLSTGMSQVGLYTAYFDGTSWTHNPEPVLRPDSPNSTSPYTADAQLAIGGTGDGVVVFDEYNSSDAGKAINVAVVNLIGPSRTPPQMLSNDTTGGIGQRFVSMNASSEAVVVWWDDVGLVASTYKPAGTWSTPQKIKDNGEFLLVATVLDNDGFLTAAWDQAIATGKENVMAIHGKVGGTWSEITPLETDNLAADDITELASPRLAVDAHGNVLVTWSKKINDTTWGAYARRLQGTEWQPQVELGKKSDLQTVDPVVAVADSGFGAAVFEYHDFTGKTTDPDAYNVEVAFCR
jgi:hypothetical protein